MSALSLTRAPSTCMAMLGIAVSAAGCPTPARYDTVMQKGTHNSYLRESSLFDQLVYHRIRSFELDVAVYDAGFPVHHVGEHETSCTTLSDCVDIFRAFHDATPQHEVVTIWIEPSDLQNGKAGAGRFPTSAIEQVIGKLPLWRPQDLIDSCPNAVASKPQGEPSLMAAVAQCGFPTTDGLRGKFIVVLMEADPSKGQEIFALTDYIGAGDGTDRAMFVAPRPNHLENMGPSLAVFLNDFGEKDSQVDRGRRIVRRMVEQRRTSKEWDGYAVEALQHVANDHENWLDTSVPVTHNAHGWPFRCLQTNCDGAVEPSELIGLQSTSGDIESNSDSFSFAFQAYVGNETKVSAFISAPSGKVEGWAKGCLMMRESEGPAAPYYAICRAADGSTVRTQLRSTSGGSTKNTQLALDAERTGVFVELSASVRGSSTCFTPAVSTNGTNWVPQNEDCIEGLYPLQGLAVSSHGNAPVHFLFGNLRRAGASVSTADLKLVPVGTVRSASLFDGPIPP